MVLFWRVSLLSDIYKSCTTNAVHHRSAKYGTEQKTLPKGKDWGTTNGYIKLLDTFFLYFMELYQFCILWFLLAMHTFIEEAPRQIGIVITMI